MSPAYHNAQREQARAEYTLGDRVSRHWLSWVDLAYAIRYKVRTKEPGWNMTVVRDPGGQLGVIVTEWPELHPYPHQY